MVNDKLSQELSILVDQYGFHAVVSAISSRRFSGDVLSIISDGSMHRQPDELLTGTKYIFSEGMIDTSSDTTVAAHLEQCCRKLADELRKNRWVEIRLFFSGHALLAAYAKMTVYRVTHLNTIDYGFFGEAGFRQVDLDLRRHVITNHAIDV